MGLDHISGDLYATVVTDPADDREVAYGQKGVIDNDSLRV